MHGRIQSTHHILRSFLRRNSTTKTTANNVPIVTLYALRYNYVSDVSTKRTPLRPAHLQHARLATEAGALLAGGAFNPPSEGGLLIFKGNRAFVENFAMKV